MTILLSALIGVVIGIGCRRLPFPDIVLVLVGAIGWFLTGFYIGSTP